jgi:hypothetical protein
MEKTDKHFFQCKKIYDTNSVMDSVNLCSEPTDKEQEESRQKLWRRTRLIWLPVLIVVSPILLPILFISFWLFYKDYRK